MSYIKKVLNRILELLILILIGLGTVIGLLLTIIFYLPVYILTGKNLFTIIEENI